MYRKNFLNVVLVAIISISLLAMSAPLPRYDQSNLETNSTDRSTTNSNQTQSQQPQVLPPSMPVYAIMPTLINPDIILGNANRFNGSGANDVYSQVSRGGLDHFFAFNPDTGYIIDEFNRTGGLFAVNYSRAYTETEFIGDLTNTDICLFLADRQLFPSEVDPLFTDCAGNPPYSTKQIHLSTVDPSNGRGTNSIIGELVQVPLAIDIGIGAPDFIPMGGPGGHLSLLLAGNPNMPSLDSSLPGLQALASPWFGRMRVMDPIGYYPTILRQEAIDKFKAGFPAGTEIDPGTPVMVYYVGFPDVPQDAVMPMWTFPDATAIISGTVVSLKDSALPGVVGFAPDVTILSPADGTIFLKNQPVSITFSITGDQGPFTYTVSSDDSVVASGVTVSGTFNVRPGCAAGIWQST